MPSLPTNNIHPCAISIPSLLYTSIFWFWSFGFGQYVIIFVQYLGPDFTNRSGVLTRGAGYFLSIAIPRLVSCWLIAHLLFTWVWLINPLYQYIVIILLPLPPPSSNLTKWDAAILTCRNGRYGHYKDSVFRSKIEKHKQFSPAARSGTSKISPVSQTRRKPDSNIRQNKTNWESGFLSPGTPARY